MNMATAPGTNGDPIKVAEYVAPAEQQLPVSHAKIKKLPTLPIYSPPHLRATKGNASEDPGMPLANATTSTTPCLHESNGEQKSNEEQKCHDIDLAKVPPHLRHKYIKKTTPPGISKATELPLVDGNASPSTMVSNASASGSNLRSISPLTLDGQTSNLVGKVTGPNDRQLGSLVSAEVAVQKPHDNTTDSTFKPISTASYPRGFFSCEQQGPPADGRPGRFKYEETTSFVVPETKPKAGTKKVAKDILALDVPFTDQIARAIDIGAKFAATARAKRMGIAADDLAALVGPPEQ